MTIYMTPHITDDKIAAMDVFDAFRLGEELLDSRFPRDAARVLRKVVDAEPGHAGAWELLGRAHFAAAQLSPAEESFRRLVDLEPTSAWAQTALGLALDRQSRHREGVVHHRIAAAMGASPRDATRVELVDRPTG
ncbi:tetratricopeptide repeat protein [Aeromicrobium yanjiei]|uniref:Tetratricopeptide repeat protein n=1 Tax=Aeromicrobium yanjiei TaxID=2662028 RepID=A0A5Q2MJ87_9ACTN|nr:tetratricopeptide repeat protein [Aeromicrobium yanjiei]QGG41783.1 tetratricopeptide repeat protein [Aeromicrobium yanjiei]